MTPDWAQCPNGTTHWAPASRRFRECWFKHDKGQWFFMPKGLASKWMPMNNEPSIHRISGMRVRP